MTVEEAGRIVALLVGLVTLLTVAVKVGRALRARRAVARAETLAAREQLRVLARTVTEELLPAVSEIRAQLETNGGSSLRDVLIELRNEHALERAARRAMSNVVSFEVQVRRGVSEVRYVSPAWVHMTGLTRDDCADDGWLRCVHEDDRERVQAGAARAYADGKVFVTTYRVFNVHSGALSRVEHTGTPVFNGSGDCVGWVAVLRPRAATGDAAAPDMALSGVRP